MLSIGCTGAGRPHPLAQACDCDASVAFQLSGSVFWWRDRYPLCSQGSSALVALLGEVPA